jgi:hypothetical protein
LIHYREETEEVVRGDGELGDLDAERGEGNGCSRWTTSTRGISAAVGIR